jgi:hypothetical protein
MQYRQLLRSTARFLLLVGASYTAASDAPLRTLVAASRRLDQGASAVNIASYSVKFEQCQFVKSYSATLAASEYSTTVLSTERFVLFRLCPNGDCGSCAYNYGEYLVDLQSYLQATVQYYQSYQDVLCQACDNTCGGGGGGRGRDLGGGKDQFYNVVPNCTSCVQECDLIDNMQAYGYIDATDFLECTMIYASDDNSEVLWAGPICANSGHQIEIGVFSDENCVDYDDTKDVNDYLYGNGVSMHVIDFFLKKTYTNTCISCQEPSEQNENAQEGEDADTVTELCEQLYDDAAKCEKTHGFAGGYANYYGYENQLAQEEAVCEFIVSLKAGTYDETGEILLTGAMSRSAGSSTTGAQKLALCFFTLSTFALTLYAIMLHRQLQKRAKRMAFSPGTMT